MATAKRPRRRVPWSRQGRVDDAHWRAGEDPAEPGPHPRPVAETAGVIGTSGSRTVRAIVTDNSLLSRHRAFENSVATEFSTLTSRATTGCDWGRDFFRWRTLRERIAAPASLGFSRFTQ